MLKYKKIQESFRYAFFCPLEIWQTSEKHYDNCGRGEYWGGSYSNHHTYFIFFSILETEFGLRNYEMELM